MLKKTFRLSILMLLLCLSIFFVLKEVNSLDAGQDRGMFIPEGPEDEHFVYEATFKDNLQFVNSRFLKNVQLISIN